MKTTLLSPEELEYIDNLDDPQTLGEICEYLPCIRVGIRLDDNTLLGTMTLFNINPQSHKAEFGMHILDSRGTLGAAREAKKFLKEAFERLNLNRIYIRVHYDNERCLSCVKRFGFRYEGTERQSLLVCGEYKDILVFSILREEWLKNEFKEQKVSEV